MLLYTMYCNRPFLKRATRPEFFPMQHNPDITRIGKSARQNHAAGAGTRLVYCQGSVCLMRGWSAAYSSYSEYLTARQQHLKQQGMFSN